MSTCVICEKSTSGSLEFCQKHYKQYQTDIKDKRPWVRVLKNDAQRERRRKEREYDNASLDQIMDRYTDSSKTRWDI